MDDERSDKRRGTKDAPERGQDTELLCGHGPPPLRKSLFFVRRMLFVHLERSIEHAPFLNRYVSAFFDEWLLPCILFLFFETGYKNEYLFIISMNRMKIFTFSRFTETVLF